MTNLSNRELEVVAGLRQNLAHAIISDCFEEVRGEALKLYQKFELVKDRQKFDANICV